MTFANARDEATTAAAAAVANVEAASRASGEEEGSVRAALKQVLIHGGLHFSDIAGTDLLLGVCLFLVERTGLGFAFIFALSRTIRNLTYFHLHELVGSPWHTGTLVQCARAKRSNRPNILHFGGDRKLNSSNIHQVKMPKMGFWGASLGWAFAQANLTKTLETCSKSLEYPKYRACA